MAKNRKITLGDPGDGAPTPDTRSPMERERERQENTLVELIKAAGMTDGIVALKRRAVNETDFGHLAEMSTAVFSEENVRKIYGGGDYRAQFKTSTGTFAGNYSFKVDYSIPSKFPNAASKPDDERREDRTPELVTALTAAMKSAMPPPAPPPDNSIMLKFIEMQGQQITALLTSRSAAPDPALAELRAEIRALKENGGGNKRGKLRDEIEDMMAIMDLTGGRGGGGGDAPEKPDRVTELIRALAPAVAPMVARMMGGPMPDPAQLAAMNGAQPLLAAGQPLATQPATQPGQTTQPDDMNIFLKPFIGEFRRVAILAASKGRDAFEWADAKLDDIDPRFHPAIFQLANAENWFAEMFGGDPTANAHVAWLLEMRNAILTRFFVADVTNAFHAAPAADPAPYAAQFLDRVSVSFHERLWDLLDPEAWKQTFANSVATGAIPNTDWLEKLRVAFEDELSEEEPTAETVAAEPGKTEVPPPAPTAAPVAPILPHFSTAKIDRVIKAVRRKAKPATAAKRKK